MASSSSQTPLTPSSLHFLILAIFVLLASVAVSASTSPESPNLMERLQAGRPEPPFMAILNDQGDVIATAKRNEPWMSILASNLFKDGNLNSGSMNYRGLRG
ncbi:hypothetical protein QR680_004736 [Steinernema hermaphroditum]|uniref:Uncharacterized protein n=1 Tax=Steinernema hermaphroditum TaxID=289476 RepID=A0AA39LTP2_9BILA|nr:hypothetical protein QR680_004736 [Steinernema hermaphroditum]